GLKGYVTNIPTETMSGSAVIGAYHDLWEVEASFRLTKSDLAARPVFHRTCEAIEAHLTDPRIRRVSRHPPSAAGHRRLNQETRAHTAAHPIGTSRNQRPRTRIPAQNPRTRPTTPRYDNGSL